MSHITELTTAYEALIEDLKGDPTTPPSEAAKAAVAEVYAEYADGREARSDLVKVQKIFTESDDYGTAVAGAVAQALIDAHLRSNKGSKATDPTPSFGTPEGDEVIGNRLAKVGQIAEQLFEKVADQSDLRTTELVDAIELLTSLGDPEGDLYLPSATTKGDWAAEPKAGSGTRTSVERDESSVPEGDYPLVGSDKEKTNGTMRSDGKGNLTWIVGSDEYTSPSAAAKAVTGSQTNGWDFWTLDGVSVTEHFGPEYAGPDPS